MSRKQRVDTRDLKDICPITTNLLPSRFREKLSLNYWTRCWQWMGALSDAGYGIFSYSGGTLAHRFAYESVVGPIVEGFHVDHLCRVHSCVNPAHLEAVTPTVNKQRGVLYRRTYCRKGHIYTGLKPSGKPYCQACRNQCRPGRAAADRQADIDNPSVYQRDPDRSNWIDGEFWHWPSRHDASSSACGKVFLIVENGCDATGVISDRCARSGCRQRWPE